MHYVSRLFFSLFISVGTLIALSGCDNQLTSQVLEALKEDTQKTSSTAATEITSGNVSKNSKNVADELFDAINGYRLELGLKAIPRSEQLTQVAQFHARDTALNEPHKLVSKTGKACNLHSWSNVFAEGKTWTPICYTSDHKEAENMWNKPAELTNYSGKGYEISAISNSSSTRQASYYLELWKKSTSHHNVIVNKDIWADVTWKAMGVGFYENAAHVWFGKEEDPLN